MTRHDVNYMLPEPFYWLTLTSMLPDQIYGQIQVFDENDPRSVINVVNKDLQRIFKRARDASTSNGTPALELFNLPEAELKSKLRAEFNIEPNIGEQRIRLAFWYEYEQAQLQFRKMEMDRIVAGVCRSDQFLWYLKKPEIVAYILCPPTNYIKALQTAINYGVDELHEILSLPIRDKHSGKINFGLVNAKLKIYQILDMRVNGAYTQKIEQTNKTMRLNVNSTLKEIGGQVNLNSMDDIQKRIKHLEEIKKIANIPDEVDE